MIKKKEREEYEYSPLIQFIKVDWINNTSIYKKIDLDIILDSELTINDLSIYLAIVKSSSFKNYFKEISHKNISNICGVIQSDQIRSTQKLKEKGYIKVICSDGNSNSYKIDVNPSKYIPLRLEQFDGLLQKKIYIRRLRGLALSYGNNIIPNFKTALNKFNGKLTRVEFKKIKKTYYYDNDRNLEIDIDNYLKLMW